MILKTHQGKHMLSDHLDKLRSFKTIAEIGKIREASVRLNLTQPSLTRLIQTLELACGKTLFHRSRQGVTLTESGKILYDFSSSLLKELEDIEEKLKNPTMEMSGQIRIGSYESLAEYFWPEFVLSIRSLYPELKLSLKTNSAVTHQNALESGQLDMLVDAEPRLLGNFTSWTLYKDKFNFYGKKGSVFQELNPETAKNLSLIYCPSAVDENNKSILMHLDEAGYQFKERIELDSFTTSCTFGKNGIGLCVLPQRLAEEALKSKKLVHINMTGFSPKGFGTHSICATIRSSSEDDKRLRLIIKLLREWFKT
jgi:DNA-binding transcriptional LysR family regulator